MVHYSIIHTEDDPSTANYVGNNAKQQGMTYCNADSLNSLEALLPDNSADVWIVDGRFAKIKGEIIEYLAPQAIFKIRGRYKDARIILYSGESDIEMKAREYGVEFFRKIFTARELIENVQQMIGEQPQVQF